ncbi:MAG TPA: hypothetical protein VGK46_10510, partial [Saprospiraceae bacterium]
MAEGSINNKSLKGIRIGAILLLSLLGTFSAWKMFELPLWGLWPLFLILGFYLAAFLLLLPSDLQKRKWLGLATLSGVLLGLGFPP